MVDKRRLQGQIARRVDAAAFVLRRFRRRLAHRQQVKVGVVTLVEEELAADTVDDDVPGVGRARAAHKSGQNGIRCKHVALLAGDLKG